jgi:cell division septum initiation protein DivIVA
MILSSTTGQLQVPAFTHGVNDKLQIKEKGKKMEEIIFGEQKNGYNKDQVDKYIRKLTEAYETAYKEYTNIRDKHNDLLQEHGKLEAGNQNSLNSEIIAKTLLDAEKLSKDIIESARAEENRILDMTLQNVEYAYKTLKEATDEIQKYLSFNNVATE